MKNLILFEKFQTSGEDYAEFAKQKSGMNFGEAVKKAIRTNPTPPIILKADDNKLATDAAAKEADGMGRPMILVDLQYLAPDDFKKGGNGLPPASFLPYGNSKDPMLLMFINAGRADKRVVGALFQLAFKRELEGYTLPENCVVVLTHSSGQPLPDLFDPSDLMTKGKEEKLILSEV